MIDTLHIDLNGTREQNVLFMASVVMMATAAGILDDSCDTSTLFETRQVMKQVFENYEDLDAADAPSAKELVDALSKGD